MPHPLAVLLCWICIALFVVHSSHFALASVMLLHGVPSVKSKSMVKITLLHLISICIGHDGSRDRE